MTRFKPITFCIISAMFLNSCSEILEPVSFFGGKQDLTMEAGQEEFEINIKSLTFNTAKKANYAAYPRRLILNGSGSNANVFDEAKFLKSNFPKQTNNFNYHLGIGDEISFILLSEFMAETARWPSASEKTEYLLGAGDELTFTQSNDSNKDISVSISGDGRLVPTKQSDALILTKGVIGSNGNILLYGLGNILAANRTLDDVRAEIRNILIRNGLAPNFQLEISDFQSQKFFITGDETVKSSIPLNNLPVSLKEVALSSGISKSNGNFAIIKLKRNKQEFRFTAKQLFALKAPEITIQHNDQIEFQIAPNESVKIKSVVGSKGNILLGKIAGNISAANRTLDDIYEEISNTLKSKGIKPSFQLELTSFASKKAFLIQKGSVSKVMPLTNQKITLKELIVENIGAEVSTDSLSIITLKRNGQTFRMTLDHILDSKSQDIWIIDGDQLEVDSLTYKPGQVFALSGAGQAQVVFINPSKRETLADILFEKNGALNNLLAKRSEVYLLRGKNPSIAYHLDAQNVSRILVAAKTELRPNDIVYVADRPIISFTRTLAEINPLRSLLRDIENNNIP